MEIRQQDYKPNACRSIVQTKKIDNRTFITINIIINITPFNIFLIDDLERKHFVFTPMRHVIN